MKSCFLGALIIVTMMFGSADICAATMTDTKKAAVSQDLGPVLPYQQMEAEDCITDGEIVAGETAYFTPGSEASCKSYVRLSKADQKISFMTMAETDTLMIRASVPDAATGGGMSYPLLISTGSQEQTVMLSSKLSWVYGEFPWSNDPKEGHPHNYFDDTLVVFETPIAKGTEITISVPKKEDGAAIEYLIDLFDTELRPPVLPQPKNSLSIEDFGAVADDGKDDSGSFNEAIAKAAETGRSLYVPEGVFDIYNPALVNGILLTKDGVEIVGAGMWYTRLKTKKAGFYIRGEDITLRDLALFGQTDIRRDNEPPAIAVESDSGQSKNIRLENLWIEHIKVGVWANRIEKLTLTGSRIRNVMADGINLCKGTSNSEVSYNDFRNTGDDGIALWSNSVANENNQIFHNTVRYPWLANNIAIYGGKSNEVYENDLRDTVGMGSGINLSTRFKPQAFSGETIIRNNLLIRCGSLENDTKAQYGGIWINTEPGFDNKGTTLIKNNEVRSSPFQGIYIFNSGQLENMIIEENKLLGGGTYGVEVDPNAQGEVILLDNQFEDFPKGDVSNEGSLHLKQTQNRKSRKILIGIGISALVFILSAVFLSKYIRLRKKQSIL